LGSHLTEAKRKWAKMERKPSPAEVNTIADAILRYRREVLPTKAPRTQRDNLKELNRLNAVFGHMPIDTLQPKDVRVYLDYRRDAPC
jgi:hypothetical protein